MASSRRRRYGNTVWEVIIREKNRQRRLLTLSGTDLEKVFDLLDMKLFGRSKRR
jgi:hypothetical protein